MKQVEKEILKIEKGSTQMVEITDMTIEGAGIGRMNNGQVAFVNKSVIGDKISFKVKKSKKNYVLGELRERITPSPFRVEAPCSYFNLCGGCQLQELDYPQQLEWKTSTVTNSLQRIGKLEDLVVNPTIGCEKKLMYRNKGVYHISKTGAIGFYSKDNQEIIDCTKSCLIQHEDTVDLILFIKRYLKEHSDKGLCQTLARVGVKHSVATGEMMLVLMTGPGVIEDMDTFISELRKKQPKVASGFRQILEGKDYPGTYMESVKKTAPLASSEGRLERKPKQTKNYRKTKESIEAEEDFETFATVNKGFTHMVGKPYIEDKIGSLTFKIGPESFYQVNSKQATVLYDEIKKLAGLKGGETLLDLYSGVGSIGLYLAAPLKTLIGIEQVPEAIEKARENANLNHIHNATFIEGKVEDVLDRVLEKEKSIDVVVLDPPRNGCKEDIFQTLKKINPEKIIYVSCSPQTLARDLKILIEESDYKIEAVQPVDMFPQTSKCEVVTLLSKES